jgi:activating signal cointegrator complex subunit 1
MSLVTPARIDEALTLLRSLDLRGQMPSAGRQGAGHASSRPPPLTITLRGLKSLQEPGRTSGLYAPPVDEDGSLYEFCVRIRNAFQAAGLMVSDTRPLLLHATIINTVYVEGRGRRAPKLTIDAREIMQQYDSFEWMRDIRIETVAICKMGAKPVPGGDEAYIVEGEVPVPT